jgi:hypothetical protein
MRISNILIIWVLLAILCIPGFIERDSRGIRYPIKYEGVAFIFGPVTLPILYIINPVGQK